MRTTTMASKTLEATPESDAKLREEYMERGLKWKQDGKPAHEAQVVKSGGLLARWFLEGYNEIDFERIIADED